MRTRRPVCGMICAALLAIVGCGANPERPGAAPLNVPEPTLASTNSGADSAVPGTIRIGPLTPMDSGRITNEEAAAINALGASRAGPPLPGANDMSTMNMDPHSGTDMPLSAADAVTFAAQWHAAQQSVDNFDTLEKAEALGFVRSATPESGIGTHWVSWTQIAKPFDPAHPAMLLFDERRTPAVLVGYSYWLQSPTPPVGFAGDNDIWHQHTGLCIVNGWLDREEAGGHDDCAGTFLAGGDLWMLHAWVVPGYENRVGKFYTFNPILCPSRVGTPDDLLCPI